MIDRIRDASEAGLGGRADEMKEKALDAAAVARERVTEGARMIKDYTIHQPARALGLALGMGVLLGWLIKRR